MSGRGYWRGRGKHYFINKKRREAKEAQQREAQSQREEVTWPNCSDDEDDVAPVRSHKRKRTGSTVSFSARNSSNKRARTSTMQRTPQTQGTILSYFASNRDESNSHQPEQATSPTSLNELRRLSSAKTEIRPQSAPASLRYIDLTDDSSLVSSCPSSSRSTTNPPQRSRLPASFSISSKAERKPLPSTALQGRRLPSSFSETTSSASRSGKGTCAALKLEFELDVDGRFSVIDASKGMRKRKTIEGGVLRGSPITHPEVVKVLDATPGCQLSDRTGRYTFPLYEHDTLLQKLLSCPSRKGTVEGLPSEILALGKEMMRESHEGRPDIDISAIPPALLKALMPFQMTGVIFALERGGKCIIGDEMGLGKTFQGMAIASAYRADWPLLIVCPSSVKWNWQSELLKWMKISPFDVMIVKSGKDRLSGVKVVIISYDLIPRMNAEQFKRFQCIICDESHYVKNAKAKRTKAILPLLQAANRAILMTGTPAVSRPEELYTQLAAIGCPIFKRFNPFGMRYCAGFRGRWGWDFSGASHLQELHAILSQKAMIRRLKKDVLQQLPDKLRQVVEISADNNKELKQALGRLNDVKQLMESFNEDVASGARQERRQTLMQAYGLTAAAKLKAVCQYVQMLLDGGCQKFIVFGHHQTMLDAIEDTLRKDSVGYMRIDGSVKAETRARNVTKFQTDNDVKVAILSMTAAGTGITLNAASTVVFAELFWTPAVLLQAEDRAHRIGQKSNVNIHYLLGQNTLDDSIWKAVHKKVMVLGEALDGEMNGNLNAKVVPTAGSEVKPEDIDDDPIEDDMDTAPSRRRKRLRLRTGQERRNFNANILVDENDSNSPTRDQNEIEDDQEEIVFTPSPWDHTTSPQYEQSDCLQEDVEELSSVFPDCDRAFLTQTALNYSPNHRREKLSNFLLENDYPKETGNRALDSNIRDDTVGDDRCQDPYLSEESAPPVSDSDEPEFCEEEDLPSEADDLAAQNMGFLSPSDAL